MPIKIKHNNGHESVVTSAKKSAVHGIELIISCCGEHEQSIHIQAPGKYSQAELQRVIEDHLANLCEEHASDQAALEFIKCQ